MTHLRGHVYDGATAFSAIGSFQHFAHSHLSYQKCSTHVESEDLIKMALTNINKRFGYVHASVIDQDGEVAEAGQFGAKTSSIIDIASQDSSQPTYRAYATRNSVELFDGTTHEDNLRSCFRKGNRRFSPKSTAGASNECDASIQTEFQGSRR
jgi:hypothetical protein